MTTPVPCPVLNLMLTQLSCWFLRLPSLRLHESGLRSYYLLAHNPPTYLWLAFAGLHCVDRDFEKGKVNMKWCNSSLGQAQFLTNKHISKSWSSQACLRWCSNFNGTQNKTKQKSIFCSWFSFCTVKTPFSLSLFLKVWQLVKKLSSPWTVMRIGNSCFTRPDK